MDSVIDRIMMKKSKPEQEPEADFESVGMDSCSEELLSAIESKDVKAVSSALRSAFSMMSGEEYEDED